MIKIFNSLNKKKNYIKDKNLKIFVCGPTVYDLSHIGHARTYIFFDTFVRFLKSNGYRVKFLMNITDIDDKIIKKAKKENKLPFYIAKKFEREFLKDMKSLKVESVDIYARASENIHLILKQINKLIKKKYAYLTKDGSVYFITKKFKNYGKLSNQSLSQLKEIEQGEYKKDPLDFALWKGRKKTKFEPTWKAPWGYGRPGWHIEDTAISEKYFGVQYDIHGGGIDLIFPHHECEIAQQESASGKSPFVKTWIHTNLLYVEGKKMSKSLGNVVTIRDFSKNFPLRFLRFFILAHHYRSIIDYNKNSLEDSWNKYIKINEFLTKIINYNGSKNKILIKKLKSRINKSLKDDFNTANVFNMILEFINKNEENIYELNKKDLLNLFKEIDKFLVCLFPWKKISKEDLKLIKKRELLRENKNFERADKIREELKNRFILLQDLQQKTLAINLN